MAIVEGAERPVTFNRDVAPIIFEHCSPGETAPFNLQSYDEVRQRARQIVETTSHRVMPPWKPDPDSRDRPTAPRFSDGRHTAGSGLGRLP